VTLALCAALSGFAGLISAQRPASASALAALAAVIWNIAQ